MVRRNGNIHSDYTATHDYLVCSNDDTSPEILPEANRICDNVKSPSRIETRASYLKQASTEVLWISDNDCTESF